MKKYRLKLLHHLICCLQNFSHYSENDGLVYLVEFIYKNFLSKHDYLIKFRKKDAYFIRDYFLSFSFDYFENDKSTYFVCRTYLHSLLLTF